MITAQISQADINRLNKTLQSISRATHKSMPALMRQTAYWAAVSAAKNTPPGNGTRVSRLAKKYRYRPLESLKQNNMLAYLLPEGQIFTKSADSARGMFFYKREGGKIFSTPKPISKAKKRGLNRIKPVKRLTKGIKYWAKKNNDWGYIPYTGKKRDLSDKRFKIPHAGAAKAGWIHNFSHLGKSSAGDTGGIRGNLSTYRERLTGSDMFISMQNNIDYISIVAPNVDSVAIRAAENKMIGIYKRKLEDTTRNAA